MSRRCISATVGFSASVALALQASADQPAQLRLEKSLIDPGKAVVLCSPQRSSFRIYGAATEMTIDQGFDQRYVVDYASLLVSQPGRDFIDELWRSWSRRLSVPCGRYVIEIEAGFYNANPQGMMGAAPEFLRVAISHENFQAVRWTSFGDCAQSTDTHAGRRQIDGKWIAADRETEITELSADCENGLAVGKSNLSSFRVPSREKAMEVHRRTP